MRGMRCDECGFDQGGRAATFCGRCGASLGADRGPSRWSWWGAGSGPGLGDRARRLLRVVGVLVVVMTVVGTVAASREPDPPPVAEADVGLPSEPVSGVSTPDETRTSIDQVPRCRVGEQVHACVTAEAVAGDGVLDTTEVGLVENDGQRLRLRDPETLEVRWTGFDTAGSEFVIGSWQDLVIVANPERDQVLARAADDGEIQWSVPGSFAIIGPPDAPFDTLVVVGEDGLTGVTPTGAVRWQRPGTQSGYNGNGDDAVIVTEGGATVGERRAVVLDVTDGTEVGTAPLPFAEVVGVVNRTLLTIERGSGTMRLVAHDLDAGTIAWTREDVDLGSVELVGDRVLARPDGRTESIDPQTGEVVFRLFGSPAVLSGPAEVLDTRLLVFTDFEVGEQRAHSAEDGRRLWRRELTDDRGGTVSTGSWIVVQTEDGTEFRDPLTGELVFSLVGVPTRVPVYSDPLVVPSADGDRLFRVDPPVAGPGSPVEERPLPTGDRR